MLIIVFLKTDKFNEIYYFYFGEFDMKITFEDRKKGLVALLPETLDDLWHLSHIIAEGDEVFSKTTRRYPKRASPFVYVFNTIKLYNIS